jgi:hypothetical protein
MKGNLMICKINLFSSLFSKPTIGFVLLMAISLFMVQIFCGTSLWAQSVGEMGYQYPILQEEDFKMYLRQFDTPDMEPHIFIKQNNITMEHYEAVLLKISSNLMSGLYGASESDVVALLGPSVIFNQEENDIFARYKDRIISAVAEHIDLEE